MVIKRHDNFEQILIIIKNASVKHFILYYNKSFDNAQQS